MLDEIRRTPYEGIGKPELLRGDLAGWWSRRLTYRDRIVYRVEGDRIEVLRLRFHYGEHR
jgi:toxin YoeB